VKEDVFDGVEHGITLAVEILRNRATVETKSLASEEESDDKRLSQKDHHERNGETLKEELEVFHVIL